VISWTESLQDVVGVYLMSLSMADMVCACLLVPCSIYSALTPGWHLGGDNSALCKTFCFVHIALLSASLYTFAWLCVDRYAALRKPSRYEAEQTLTRCKCWIAFSWLTAFLLSTPILVARMQVRYFGATEMCVLDWSATAAYSITLAGLVVLPSLFSICVSYTFIFSSMCSSDQLDDTQRMCLETDPHYMLSFFSIACFVLGWAPAALLRLLPSGLLVAAGGDTAPLQFVFLWLATAAPSCKLLICLFCNPGFRLGLTSLTRSCLCLCCPVTAITGDPDEYRSLAVGQRQQQRYL